MTVRVGINGFGRIGRSFTRALLARGDAAGVELVAVNDPFGDSHTMAFLLKHDSVGGMLPNDVAETASGFSIDGREVKKLEERDPGEIPWAANGVDVVIESTGLFTAREKAAGHLQGGAKRVVISAPSGDADVMICMGVNDDVFDPARTPSSRTPRARRTAWRRWPRSCTTASGSSRASSPPCTPTRPTSSSRTRRSPPAAASRTSGACAAALSIIPSSTGAARAIGLVLPDLKGKLDGTALRVPTPVGSITDLVANLGRETSIEEINAAFAEASAAPSTRGVLEYSDEPLVSADIVGNPSSCIYSALDTMANGKFVKVLGWYDNEWGYSNRLIDLVSFIGDR